MDLTIHTVDSAPAESRPVLKSIAEDLGFVPNLASMAAGSPTLLAGFDGLRRAVGSGSVDPVLRETAGLAVGVAVDNAYGVAFHSTVLAKLGVEDDQIERMRSGAEPSDPTRAAVYRLAKELVLNRGKVTVGAAQQASEVGLSTTDILEIVAECTFATLIGLIDNLAGRVQLDAFLQPRAWTDNETVSR